MKCYIPKQPKVARERIETKLDAPLLRKLESYCEYLDSDRDYVIGQALEIAFKRDQGFCDWLEGRPAVEPRDVPAIAASAIRGRRGRKPNLSASTVLLTSDAGTGPA